MARFATNSQAPVGPRLHAYPGYEAPSGWPIAVRSEPEEKTTEPAVVPQERSQCREALDKANQVREARAMLKREIFALPRVEAVGKIVTVLRNVDPDCAGMCVADLVKAPRGNGKDRAKRILRAAGITNPLLPIGRLTDRQRSNLQTVLVRSVGGVGAVSSNTGTIQRSSRVQSTLTSRSTP